MILYNINLFFKEETVYLHFLLPVFPLIFYDNTARASAASQGPKLNTNSSRVYSIIKVKVSKGLTIRADFFFHVLYSVFYIQNILFCTVPAFRKILAYFY